MDSRYKNVYGGRGTTDEEVTGLLIAILFAGQHTSSVTASWTGYRMLANRKWWVAAQEEQRAVMAEHGDKLDMDVLNSMDALHTNIQVGGRGDGVWGGGHAVGVRGVGLWGEPLAPRCVPAPQRRRTLPRRPAPTPYPRRRRCA